MTTPMTTLPQSKHPPMPDGAAACRGGATAGTYLSARGLGRCAISEDGLACLTEPEYSQIN